MDIWYSLLNLNGRLQLNNLSVNISPVTYPGQSHAHSLHSSDDLPKTVVVNLNQGSAVKSMDFHPVQHTLLLGQLSLLLHYSDIYSFSL